MASAFGHALVGYTLGKTMTPIKPDWKFYFLIIALPAMPDLDVISFNFGIPYEHWLGHRGVSHSIAFALLFAMLVKLVFYSKIEFKSRTAWKLIGLFFLIIASHGVLDAMTTGGRGVGFFIPFTDERYFLPWRMIRVSPMSAARFFSEWGLKVIKSELVWIGIPCAIILTTNYIYKRLKA